MERPTAIAQFPSRCAHCDKPIEEGDEIAYVENDGEWMHPECAEEYDT